MSKLAPKQIWWHSPFGCGVVIEQAERPSVCTCAKGVPIPPSAFEDLGYRVGYNAQTYSLYSSYDGALRDKRCK